MARSALDLFPKLGIEADGAHAFYLGTELAKAGLRAALADAVAKGRPLTYVNPAFESFFGYRADEAIAELELGVPVSLVRVSASAPQGGGAALF